MYCFQARFLMPTFSLFCEEDNERPGEGDNRLRHLSCQLIPPVIIHQAIKGYVPPIDHMLLEAKEGLHSNHRGQLAYGVLLLLRLAGHLLCDSLIC